MKIGKFDLDKRVLIIAEVGNNHEGDFKLAVRLIREAARCGADAVKFQTIVPDRLVSIGQKDRIRQLEKFRLSYGEFEKLSGIAGREGLLFLSTPFDIESARFLRPLVPAFKIASGDNDFFPLIEFIARTGKPIILSTGLADLKQIEHTKRFIENIWRKNRVKQNLAVLHCVTSYPVEANEANLLAIQTLRKSLGVTTGYSDHTAGIDAAALSIALGARIIEKHFTIDKGYSDFRDHRMSADPKEFSELVRRVRQAAIMLGDGKKVPQAGEKNIRGFVRRSIAAKHDLAKGKVIGRGDLIWIRPGEGLRPGQEKAVIGKRLKVALKKSDFILREHFK